MKEDTTSATSQEPELREHVYDGIQEYDQKLPNWWLWSFYLAIIAFFVFWLTYYSAGMLTEDGALVDSKIAEINEKKAAELEKLMATLDDSVLWKMSRNAVITDKGRSTYEVTCVACHGKDLTATLGGANLPGLPLHDSEWKYGGTPMEVFKIVSAGSPDVTKGMVAWEPSLGSAKVAEVVAYVLSQHQPPEGIDLN
ncbi:MAG: cytochrome c oxidase cbb3-type subunit 3 [Verrucomicrobiales bacterium]|jgi:cytochrome c oxidase cbb3-type subunit 3